MWQTVALVRRALAAAPAKAKGAKLLPAITASPWARRTPAAPELLMHEDDILPFATLNFQKPERAAMPIRNLLVAKYESDRNQGRRDELSHSREYAARRVGDNAAADMLAFEDRAGGAFGMKANLEPTDAKERDRIQKMEDEALAELEGGFL